MRKNNFDLIRLLSAIMVIFTHSFQVTTGTLTSEPLYLITNGQITFGRLAVAIFFMISGYLITQSYERSSNLSTYFKARFLRIFPGLIVAILLTIVFCSLISSSKDYWNQKETYTYIRNIFLLAPQQEIPGVFEKNNLKSVINGPLWSLQYEFLCYIIVAFLGRFKLLNTKFIFAFYFLTFFAYLFLPRLHENNAAEIVQYFFGGSLLYLSKFKLKSSIILYLPILALLFISIQFGFFKSWLALIGTILIIELGKSKNIINLEKIGDFSYGLYIYSFPIQQTVAQFLPEISWYVNFVISLTLTFAISAFSWHFVEKKALRYKKKVSINSENLNLI
jgi:peptidoglycan/LPS O-acetylase OafA/YrhL